MDGRGLCMVAFRGGKCRKYETRRHTQHHKVRLASLAYGKNPLILMRGILKIYSTALAFVDRIIHFKNEVFSRSASCFECVARAGFVAAPPPLLLLLT